MRAPRFWWQPGRGLLLSPLAALYGAVAAVRLRRPGRRAGVPVICVGNLTVGGAGKTPAALAVGRLLLAAHERPFFLSRGYGGRLAGPVLVNRSVHRAADVGDEPLLLARLAPTIVARNRVAGAQLARFEGASAIVMDDGFQNPALHKDLAILVIDGRRGIGNGRVLPAGPLRAPLASQMARAHALMIVGPAADSAAAVAELGRKRGLPLFHARLEPDRQTLAALAGRRILAFAGIADPDKFFVTLAEAGLTVVERHGFADHHRFTAADAQTLTARAQSENLMLVTTEKDQARMAGEPHLGELTGRTNALPARLVIDEDDAFRDLMLNVVKRR
ncbi:MAG TPA: tetraacyldisaccharide 4'-kinase [Xanthobacteraceae bacterium]|nr:tetraacyldisaccharide 4'-kinase [Xanthobacteraceae bacterium]